MIESKLGRNILVWPKHIGIEGKLIQEYLSEERLDLYISADVAKLLISKLDIPSQDRQTLKPIITLESEEAQYENAILDLD